MEVKEVKSIDNMKNFTDLFFSLYFIEEIDEHSRVDLSKYFVDLFDEIVNLSKYRKVLDKNLYDENGKFKIGDFLENAKVTCAKMYKIDDYSYDFSNDVISTEINKNKCNDICCDYSIKDNIIVSYLLMDYANLQSYLFDNMEEICVVSHSNRKLENLAQLFFAKYALYLNSINETGKVEFSKYFREILSEIMLKTEYMTAFFEKENYKFDIEEFLYYIESSRIKNYWADSWNFDIMTDNIYTYVNMEVAERIYAHKDNYMDNIVSHIISDYIKIESSIKENSKNLQLLFKSDD